MVICILIASALSLLSIFAFFGEIAKIGGILSSNNMFALMFGTNGSPRNDGYTFLFILQVIIMLVAVFGLFVAYKIKQGEDGKRGAIIAGASAVLSVVAAIMAFCSLMILEVNVSGVSLSTGPIIYGVAHILSAVASGAAAVLYLKRK